MTYRNGHADSDSENLGSNPSPPASGKPPFYAGFWPVFVVSTNQTSTNGQRTSDAHNPAHRGERAGRTKGNSGEDDISGMSARVHEKRHTPWIRPKRERDARGWIIPAKGTISRKIYDLGKRGLKAVEIARRLNLSKDYVAVTFWRIKNPEKRNGFETAYRDGLSEEKRRENNVRVAARAQLRRIGERRMRSE